MLELMRRSIGGWVAKIFIGLLVLSFAVWGVSDAFIGGQDTTVVKVGETEVGVLDYRLAYDQQVAALSRQFGRRLTREQARAFGVEQTILSQLTSGAILDENSRKMGLGLSDDNLAGMIGDDPAFRDAAGRFSRQQLQLALQNIGMREEDYIRNRESVAIRNQIVEGVASNVSLPDAFKKALARYQNERRIFDYVIIKPDAVAAPDDPSDQVLVEYFEANKTDYVAPEYRTIDIVKLEPEDILDVAAVTDTQIADEYEATKQSYAAAEKRQIQQLVFDSKENAQAIADRLKGGESFEAILTELDKTEDGIDIGLLQRSDIPDGAIADAAFSLEKGMPSDVVEGIFGPVILRVTDIQEETVKPLDEVKEEIRQRLALTDASNRLFDIHDVYEDERAAGATMQEAASKGGLTVRTIQMVDRRGLDPDGNRITDIPQSAEVLSGAFQSDEGVENAPLSIGSNGFVWYEVSKITDERQKPMEEVRDELTAAWKADQTAEAVDTLAKSVLDRVKAGETFAAVVADALPKTQSEAANDQSDNTSTDPDTQSSAATELAATLEKSAPMARTDTSDDLGEAAVKSGFAIAEGEFVTAIANDPLARAIIKVAAIEPGADVVTTAQTEEQLKQALEDDLLNQMIADLQTKQEVQVNQNAVITALGL